ncbi:MAG: hypothetical protein KKF50_00995 [Nanoarchaeota archaeon]|nr:hypothetical protein [Nanoarchaeota archaeon]
MKKGICLMLAFVFIVSFVLADITLLEPQDVYNLGDKLYVTAEGLIGAPTGNLNVDLVCGDKTINLERMSARRYDGEEALPYSLPYKVLDRTDLEIVNITDILGDCQVKLTIGSRVAVTKVFQITNTILVTAALEKESYNPGEGITVRIEAVKANGDLLYGFIEGMNSSVFSKAIEDGFVTEIFSMPDTIEAGTYDLGIRAYDRDKNGVSVLNEGFTTVSFKINQVASNMVISLSGDEAMPGEEFTVGAEITDQSGIEMIGTVSAKILSPKNEEIELAIPTGEFRSFSLPVNATPGVWKVITSFNLLAEQREFTVLENPKVEFEFGEDGVLIVKSVGNAKYNGTIQVDIGGEIRELELVMEMGEIRKFSLRAPQGEYDVAISDGESSMSQQVLLTGNAVSVSDLKSVGIFKAYSIVWIFLILILGGAGVVFYMKSKKTKTLGEEHTSKIFGVFKKGAGAVGHSIGSIGSKFHSKVSSNVPSKMKDHVASSMNFTNKSPKVQGLDSDSYSHEDNSMLDLTKKTMGTAESTLVLKGEKHPSAVVALSVKNYSELKDHAKKALIETINGTKEMKGLVDWKGEYIFIVFSPLVTKTYTNEVLATKAGFMILKSLTEYNKKFREHIDFNLGVHAGELIASKRDGKLKYTSIGNTISLAKRIADSDSGKLLVSDDIRRKMMRDLKVVKGKEIGKSQTYEVSEIKNHIADAAKLKELLKRMD